MLRVIARRGLTSHGFWLMVADREYLLAYGGSPGFGTQR